MNSEMKERMAHSIMLLLNDYEREANEHEDAAHPLAKLSLSGRIKDFLIYACAIEGVEQ